MLRNKFVMKVMRLMCLWALFVAHASLPSYCCTFLFQPELPKALMDLDE